MLDNQTGIGDRRDSAPSGGQASLPPISLPKGGGAIRGIGEKFAANPVTGTGSMSVPLATSPGRSGFGPQLSLSYDSGAGNGPFGFGWSLSLPAITRKTDKGLAQYRDAEESDVFILSGAEDLVPVLIESQGKWQPSSVDRVVDGVAYRIQRYRPRIEGLFARIERWTNTSSGVAHWRSISRDNVTTLYGKTAESRIADPADATRVFSWLICESYDDRGNAIVYRYVPENSIGVDLTQVHERNRTAATRSANRYLKRVTYGNRVSRLVQPDLAQADWMFEVVFDYGEHDSDDPKPGDANSWLYRHDPFSSYRAGFEVRTYRLCQRVLMFHHFPDEAGVGRDCLVRSTDFAYRNTRNNADDFKQGHPIASFIASITQCGYRRQPNGVLLRKTLPSLEFEYSEAVVQEDVQHIDPTSLENLPAGLDGGGYQWVDLDGEGVSGILTEQADAWFYKSNLGGGNFGPLERVAVRPSTAALRGGHQQLLDLAGDGQLDLVALSGPTPGYFERTAERSWAPFTAFASLPNVSWDDPNLRFVDLNGDGHADVLITQDDVLTWYPSLARDGFGPARQAHKPLDEERGPSLVFADGTQSVYLSDMSGDGLADLVRVRSGEVCYWPSLGYGRFGAKVTMDNAPAFDAPDQFAQRRLRLADIDGSGNTDMIYLGRDGVRLYFNQSGNSWTDARPLNQFPEVDDVSTVTAVDLFGNGTACLVWSSPLPGDTSRPMRYVDLMGGQKPHLLIAVKNNLGAETRIDYAPSTQFYLADKAAGRPWVTRLPFPVHVVERVETYDRISRNRFVTRHAYHHGHFDGIEREFRGFGLVEQWDTEEFAALSVSGDFPTGDNITAASHVPPVLTKTWVHTGAYVEGGSISKHFEHEYYHEGDESEGAAGLAPEQLEAMLLPDTLLPAAITRQDGTSLPWIPRSDELREACRALKGSILREEIYGLDGTDAEDRPYSVSERNYTIECFQPRGANPHAVFFAHPRETVDFHYERQLFPVAGTMLADPRVSHAITLDVDGYGNVLMLVASAYGRRYDDPDSLLSADDRERQRQTLVTYIENQYTTPVEADDAYRVPLISEACTYELIHLDPDAQQPQVTNLFRFDELQTKLAAVSDGNHDLPYEDVQAGGAQGPDPYRRIIERVRTLYRADDLTGPLVPGRLQSRALPFESYKLAFTPGLLAAVYQRPRVNQPPETLLPNPATVLSVDGGYVDLDGNGEWWIPSGRVFYTSDDADPTVELNDAQQHFFRARRFRDPFQQTNTVTYDPYDLLIWDTRDAAGNHVTAGERDQHGNPVTCSGDYRVLQPSLIMDPNRNRTAVAFDALGMVVGTTVLGKPLPAPVEGDLLDGFEADLTDAVTLDHLANPLADPQAILRRATTRLVYDLFAYQRTKSLPEPQPAVVYTLARETHDSDPVPAGGLKIQHSFSHSDGFGREIQKKIQAEPGPVEDGGLVVTPRWVGSGWTIFNNKGKPVRKYEPFFTPTHSFEFAKTVGVSPILCYDPVERVVATLHPNHTYEKVAFDPWRQETWDANDTVTQQDPKNDPDVGDFFGRLPDADYLPTWHARRQGGALGAQEQNAAGRAAVHAATPTVAHADSLGRPFLTVAHNRFKYSDTPPADPPTEEFHRTRVILDIEGNQRAVEDERKKPDGTLERRIVMRYDYDMLGNRIHQASMEAGERWMLNDVVGKPVCAWDSRNHQFRTAYDLLRRPTDSILLEGAGAPQLVGQTVYGEARPDAEANNLRGKVVLVRDQAGVVTSDDYDFKGNRLRSRRQLAHAYKTTLDWFAAVPLDADTYTNSARYDALNRPIQLIAPHSDQPGSKVNVIQHIYNEANLLEQVHVWLNQNAEPAVWLNPATADLHVITNIDYNAKGQRMGIDHATQDGKLISTSCAYAPDTFRLTHLYTRRGVDSVTRRGAAFPNDCDNLQPSPPTIAAPESPPEGKACGLQNLHYTYDPVGNITHIHDDAQQTIYFRNNRVEPSADYTYDAIYRLIEATGREHLGQLGGSPIPHSYNDAPRVGITWSANDGNAMGRYLERYVYDAVGNILSMQHSGTDPVQPGWTRAYAYDEHSLNEPGKRSNRLTLTTIGATPETYSTGGDGYDAHGNMLRMPQLQIMQWDSKDQLQMTQRQAVNAADDEGAQRQGERTWHVYDASGQRVRKVTERATGNVKNERIYISVWELYREYDPGNVAVTLERETLHIIDDKQRVALVETKTRDVSVQASTLPETLTRYQFGNHLGSAMLELNDQAQPVSYEEYCPYGSTAYQAVRSQTEAPKRYRYIGKERDEESGLYYHRARYNAAWLGRWISCDPAGMVDGTNSYLHVSGNPITFVDSAGTDAKQFVDLMNRGYSPWLAEKMVEHPDQCISIPKYLDAYGWPIDASGKRIQDSPHADFVPDTGQYRKPGREIEAEAAARGRTLEAMKHSVLGAALGNAAAQHGYSPIQQALAAEFGENAGNIVGAGTSTIQARINNQIVSGSTTTNKPDVTVSAPKVPPSVLQTAPPSSAGPPGGGGPLFPNLTDAEIGIDIQAGTAVVGPVAKNPSTGEGLIAVPLPRFDANASIAHQETMIFRGIRGAGGQLVEVRRHSPNSRAPHGSYSRANPTTQVNTVKVDKSTGLPRTGPGGRTYSDKFMDPSGNFIRPKNDVEWQSVHSR